MNLVELAATAKYPTDKGTGYLSNYEEFFAPLRDKEVKLLELGIFNAGSLLLWRDYFPKGICAGLDLNQVAIEDSTGRIRPYQGNQMDTGLLGRIAQDVAPEGFDFIIDDCSHVGLPTATSFRYLFDNHLKSGGVYCIEDWGTGYWPSWYDGASYTPPAYNTTEKRFISHNHGVVGFVKTLIDECGMGDITHPTKGIPPYTPTKIKKLQISGGPVFVVKA